MNISIQEILSYLPENSMLLIVGIYCIGIALKRTDFIKDKYILLILTIIGVIFSCALYKEISMFNILVGIICTSLSNFVNQLFKQINKEE